MELLYKSFAELGIEYFAVLDYKDLIETGENIRKRAGFEPRSAIIFLLPYYGGECENISRYAASLDYHIALREIGEAVIGSLKEYFPEMHAHPFGDHSPINECHAALISGLGVAGDNGLLINEKYGSYVFIGDIITDIPAELLGAITPKAPKRCEGCGACKRACPTGILKGEGESCLSEITQRKGTLSDDEAALMRKYNTAWGCDVCQQVCPHNRSPRLTPVKFFHKERISRLTREKLDGLDKESLRARAFGWRGRAVLERNLDILGDK